jgi:hypothetical protein
MGLDVTVGVFTLVEAGDTEYEAYLLEQFGAINVTLRECGLPSHAEPEALAPERTFCQRIGTYGTLHVLRRFAVRIAVDGMLPAPAIGTQDDLLKSRCFDEGIGGGRFSHLIDHSDAEGYYLPIRFPEVLHADPALVAGGWIGSSYQLLEECRELAGWLEVPLDLDPDSDELWGAASETDGTDILWRRYAIESGVCVRLFRAAQVSVETGAAIVFS